MPLSYITREHLATIIVDESKLAQRDYLVVDVRDDDRAGGHIKHSVHLPSYEFLRGVDELVRKAKSVPVVIFHCALSQVRGPKAARIYDETRRHQLRDDDPAQEVLILRGGFEQFQEKFKDHPKLVEGWDKDIWGPD